MGSYIPSTSEERQAMLETIGINDIHELFAHVPQEALLSRPLDLPEGQSERDVAHAMQAMAAKNVIFDHIFRGAGAYKHYIPAAVKRITSKEEFVTAYTPYQAEISQGVLQGIFEYQTMICELTTMEAANASVYDGATAAAEAAAMCRDRKRSKVLISAAAHPDVIETVKTYCQAAGAPVELIPAKDGQTDQAALAELLTADTACVYLQQPNYYGLIEDAEAFGQLAHEKGAKFIMGCNPIALAVLKSPAACGADIVVGEGQPLGLPLGFGGPYLGFMASTSAMTRKLPGRIVGETTDVDGKRAFVLTLQAREQHIRREKASSNVCSNEALCALTASVYMTVMGPEGLRQAAVQSMSKAHYLAEQLSVIGYQRVYEGEFFHEFVTTTPVPAESALKALEERGILGGLPLNDHEILWCATEDNTKAEIDELVAILKEVRA